MNDHNYDENEAERDNDENENHHHRGVACLQDEAESEILTDPTSLPCKQSKESNAIINDSYKNNYESNFSSLYQDNDRILQYKRLLHDAEQALANRDALIVMLQEQYKKIENLYKKSLNETQDFRYKYSITVKEFRNLKRICEKYRKDITVLRNEKENDQSSEETISMKNEIDNWKSQCKELLNKIEFMENNSSAAEIIPSTSKDVQVELVVESQNLKSDLEVLKKHFINVEDILGGQNRKLEFIVGTLQEDLRQSEKEREELEKVLIISKERLLAITNGTEMEQVSSEGILQTSNNDKDNLKLSSGKVVVVENLDSVNNSPQIQQLVSDLQTLRSDIQGLYGINLELKNKIDQKQDLQEQPPITNLVIRDSLLTALKQENLQLRHDIDWLKEQQRILLEKNFSECFCTTEQENINKPKINLSHLPIAKQETGQPTIAKPFHSSRVSFALPYSVSTELVGVTTDAPTQTIQGDLDDKESLYEEITKLNEEIVALQNQLQQKGDELEGLRGKPTEIAGRKNEFFQELTARNESMKNDYEELLKRKDAIENTLQQKLSVIGNYELEIVNLKSKNEELKSELGSLIENRGELLQTNSNLQDKLDNKMEELSNLKTNKQKLQDRIDELQTTIASVKEENGRCLNEKRCHEKTQSKLNELQIEVTQLTSLLENFKSKNNAFAAKEIEMSKLLEQYKEEVEFKKLENEKLLKIEKTLQQTLSLTKIESRKLENEHQQEVEKNKQMICGITNEYNNFKTSCQNNINRLNENNAELMKTIESKNKEIKFLKDENLDLTQQLDKLQTFLQNQCNAHDRCLSEISYLFKVKEDEVLVIGEELKGQEKTLEKLEKENNTLKKIVAEKKNAFKADEKLLYETKCQQENEKQMQQKLSQCIQQTSEVLKVTCTEKLKNPESPSCVNQIRDDFCILKVELLKLLNNLEHALGHVAHSAPHDDCDVTTAINSNNDNKNIQLINSNLKPPNITSSKIEGPEEIIQQTSFNNSSSCCYIPDCYNSNDDQSSRELLIKKEYLIKKIEGINNELECLNVNAEPKESDTQEKCSTSAECIAGFLKSPTLSATDLDDLLFKHKHYSHLIENINEELKRKSSENICAVEKQTVKTPCSSEPKTIDLPQDKLIELKDKFDTLQSQIEATHTVSDGLVKLENQILTRINKNDCQQTCGSEYEPLSAVPTGSSSNDNSETSQVEEKQADEVKSEHELDAVTQNTTSSKNKKKNCFNARCWKNNENNKINPSTSEYKKCSSEKPPGQKRTSPLVSQQNTFKSKCKCSSKPGLKTQNGQCLANMILQNFNDDIESRELNLKLSNKALKTCPYCKANYTGSLNTHVTLCGCTCESISKDEAQ